MIKYTYNGWKDATQLNKIASRLLKQCLKFEFYYLCFESLRRELTIFQRLLFFDLDNDEQEEQEKDNDTRSEKQFLQTLTSKTSTLLLRK